MSRVVRKAGVPTKRQKKRIKWLSSCTRWRRVGEEQEYGDILLTRVSRKPPAYKCETTDGAGNSIVVGLEKAAKGMRGWVIYLPGGEGQVFRTKKRALRYVSELQVAKVEAAPTIIPSVPIILPKPEE